MSKQIETPYQHMLVLKARVQELLDMPMKDFKKNERVELAELILEIVNMGWQVDLTQGKITTRRID